MNRISFKIRHWSKHVAAHSDISKKTWWFWSTWLNCEASYFWNHPYSCGWGEIISTSFNHFFKITWLLCHWDTCLFTTCQCKLAWRAPSDSAALPTVYPIDIYWWQSFSSGTVVWGAIESSGKKGRVHNITKTTWHVWYLIVWVRMSTHPMIGHCPTIMLMVVVDLRNHQQPSSITTQWWKRLQPRLYI